MNEPVFVEAPDGTITLNPEQAAALRTAGHLEEGETVDFDGPVVSGRLTIMRTDLTRPQVVAFLVERVDLSVCDFCGRRDVSWEFPAEDYLRAGGHDRSVGSWRACSECGQLINSGRREDLARRGARELRRPVRVVRHVHDEFWAHRQGAGRALA